MTTPDSVTLYDPAGKPRATLASPAPFEALVGAAWGLGRGDSLQVLALAEQHWVLMTYRPGRVPVCAPTGIESGPIAQANGKAVRDSMVEAAWAELLDEGWRVEESTQRSAD